MKAKKTTKPVMKAKAGAMMPAVPSKVSAMKKGGAVKAKKK